MKANDIVWLATRAGLDPDDPPQLVAAVFERIRGDDASQRASIRFPRSIDALNNNFPMGWTSAMVPTSHLRPDPLGRTAPPDGGWDSAEQWPTEYPTPPVEVPVGRPGRRFYLQRNEDTNGVSGVGRVLEGIEMPSGKIVVEWRGPRTSIAVYDDLDMFQVIHLYGGQGNELIWLDDETDGAVQ